MCSAGTVERRAVLAALRPSSFLGLRADRVDVFHLARAAIHLDVLEVIDGEAFALAHDSECALRAALVLHHVLTAVGLQDFPLGDDPARAAVAPFRVEIDLPLSNDDITGEVAGVYHFTPHARRISARLFVIAAGVAAGDQ